MKRLMVVSAIALALLLSLSPLLFAQDTDAGPPTYGESSGAQQPSAAPDDDSDDTQANPAMQDSDSSDRSGETDMQNGDNSDSDETASPQVGKSQSEEGSGGDLSSPQQEPGFQDDPDTNNQQAN